MSAENYYQMVIRPNPGRKNYTPPVWRTTCTREGLRAKVEQVERDENVTVTEVRNEDTHRKVNFR